MQDFSQLFLLAPTDTGGDDVPDDFDGVVDNCPTVNNPDQTNTDA